MEMIYIWPIVFSLLWIGLIVGFLLGVLFGRKKKKYDGVFRVDTANPEKDIFSLELGCALGSIPEKKELVFKVVNECSQEKPSL